GHKNEFCFGCSRRLLAHRCRSAMPALWSLTEAKRTSASDCRTIAICKTALAQVRKTARLSGGDIKRGRLARCLQQTPNLPVGIGSDLAEGRFLLGCSRYT